MKVKMLVALAASAVWACSFCYAANPEMMDNGDNNANQPMVLADNGMNENSAMSGSSAMSGNSSSTNNMNGGSSSGDSSNDMNADTATGDDDY